jgi:hypothetical protein
VKEKKLLAIIILLGVIFLGLALLTKRGRFQRGRWWSPTPGVSPLATFSSLGPPSSGQSVIEPIVETMAPLATPPLPTMSPTPRPTLIPTLSPVPTPSGEQTYQISISEDEFNGYLAQMVAEFPSENYPIAKNNPPTEAVINLEDGIAVFRMHFEKGQYLTGEIFVAPGGRDLDIQNVKVTGAGSFESIFTQIASDLINTGLDNFMATIRGSLQIQQIAIQAGNLIVHYQLF